MIVGASGHARVVIDIVERQDRFRIAGLLDRSQTGECLDYPVLGTESDLARVVRECRVAGGLIAIGDNWTRYRVARLLEELVPGFPFMTAIHPSAQVARGAVVGAGSVVMAGAVLNPNARVGRFCIVNTRASLDHDSIMSDFSTLGPNAATGGNVRIGEFSAVALGAGVIHGIRIGPHTVVGAGATVLHDLPDHVVAYGTPAETVRRRETGERYL